MENPLTKKMEDYQKHKKQKSCKSWDLQDSVAEREVPELNRCNSLIFSYLQISTFLRVASVKLNYEYFVIMQ